MSFAAAIVDGGTGEFVRDDGTPVEISNIVTVRQAPPAER